MFYSFHVYIQHLLVLSELLPDALELTLAQATLQDSWRLLPEGG